MLEHAGVRPAATIPRTIAAFFMVRLLGLARLRREVLEELRNRGVDLALVLARARDLITRLAAPHELLGLGVDEIHDEIADRDVRLGGRRHPAAHAAPASIAPPAHAR